MAPEKPWVSLGTPWDETDKLLFFAASTEIQIGNGIRTSFYYSGWVASRWPKDIAPDVFAISKQKKQMRVDALTANQ